ncbi:MULTISPECIES: hypothetical protein [unclassified Halanaerobium]|uniref:hypothetical protein n=1 Tax=unclassified Halanaerobium TaxID=2641197 RepID=UPI000DF41FB3|nr:MULTISPECIES: hypothetical protein [unclassified Halanaerobium]RCW44111.1 hypothetical protein DFR78_12112 [Halanaerobium sp. MA284_MarDTE_T2]RCW86969.1 hypothetical protein DER71_10677 [Halanaerobium sp. DL-01]
MFKKYSSVIFLIIFTIIMLTLTANADRLYLNSGENYFGDVLNEYLEIKTPYADIRLVEVYLTGVENRGDSFVIAAGDRNIFSGKIIGEALVFDAEGEILTIKNEDIKRILFDKVKKIAADNKTVFKMNNKDSFLGKLMNKTITIKSPFGSNLEIASDQIKNIKFNSGNKAVIMLKDGKKRDTEITLKTFVIKPGAGRIFSVNASDLKEINF